MGAVGYMVGPGMAVRFRSLLAREVRAHVADAYASVTVVCKGLRQRRWRARMIAKPLTM